MFTSLHLRLICFLALLFYVVCFKLSDNSLLDKTCRKRLTAYLPSLKLFLPLPSDEKSAKQANLAPHRVFLLCSAWRYFLIGLFKVVSLFGSWQIFEKTWVNLWELYKLLWMKKEEAPKRNVKAFANWLIHSDSWFLIGWKAFPTCEKVDSRLRLDEKISIWVFHAINQFYPKISVCMK